MDIGDQPEHRTSRSVWMVLAALALSAMACSGGGDDPEEHLERDASIYMMVDADGAADVSEAELTVTTCGGDEVASRRADIEDWTHEGMRPAYLSGDDHLILEEYVQVVAGCYDLEMALYGDGGEPSARCTTAVGENVEVGSEEDAEVLLFGRCDGVEEDPTVEMLEFAPSAFAGCDDEIEVCATVRGDGGDVQFVWENNGGAPAGTPRVDDVESDGLRRIQCATWRPEFHGESSVRLQAISATAEVTKFRPLGQPAAPETVVLFGAVHQVLFGMYVECRDDDDEE